MADDAVAQIVNNLKKGNLGTPILVVLMLAMMVLPLPPFMLDVLFTFNIALSLIVLLATIYSSRPLDFSVFPTILLVSTLLRLALNVASTRVVLLKGHLGPDAAGQVIKSFGEVVIGGNYAVGIVVFTILVIINFVVVTKGAGRISEVSARFTLDAMPGKQMAIDADLNAGIIDQEEAKNRRTEVAQEADFYGAMDGASKFVRGDAIAGLLVLFINLIGGLVIGVSQFDMSLNAAGVNYSILTIGDGIAAQVPSLLLSTAAAIMVTRVNSEQDMGSQVMSQLFGNPRSLAITAGVIGSMGAIPGMPHVAFISLAALAGGMAYMTDKKKKAALAIASAQPAEDTAAALPAAELNWDDVAPVDIIGLEIGYRLINMVDTSKDGQLMTRIKGVRKKLSQELGFLIPSVHIRDNLDLSPSAYRITLMGVDVGSAEIMLGKEMAINPGQVFAKIDGTPTRDPAFGLEAIWINPEQREYAQSQGYTVVDSSTVIATHLSQILQNHVSEIFGHEEAQQLLDKLAKISPKLVETLTPGALSLSTIVKVLQNLLTEQIPLVDIRTIAETLVEMAPKSQDPDVLTAAVRVTLKRLIIQAINGNKDQLSVITLAPELEQILQQSLQMAAENGIGLEPSLAEKIHRALTTYEQQQNMTGDSAVVLVSPQIRHLLTRLVRHSIPGLHVLSYQEIPDDKQIKIVGSIGN